MDLLINGGIAIVTMVVGYFLGKKKQDADIRVSDAQVYTSELDATEKAVAIWRNLAQDLKKEVDELRNLINELRSENEKLKNEIDQLQHRLSQFIPEESE